MRQGQTKSSLVGSTIIEIRANVRQSSSESCGDVGEGACVINEPSSGLACHMLPRVWSGLVGANGVNTFRLFWRILMGNESGRILVYFGARSRAEKTMLMLLILLIEGVHMLDLTRLPHSYTSHVTEMYELQEKRQQKTGNNFYF
jgi:hypothetical protein